MRLTEITAQHYQEHLPSESQEMKECEARAEATIARAEKMKFEAMCKGYRLEFRTQTKLADHDKLFAIKEFPKKENLLKLKMSQVRDFIKKSISETY